MTFGDCIWTALRAIRINVLRSALTALGIIIGVGAVIVMISVGAGAEARVASLIKSLGSNLVMVLNGGTSSSGARLKRGVRRSVTMDDAEAIQRNVQSAVVAAPMVRGSGQVIFGNRNWAASIEGVTPEYQEAREWGLASGRWFTASEVKAAAKVVLLGDTVIENLFPGGDALGQTVRINRVPFKVIGALAAKGETPNGNDQDDKLIVPITTAKKRLVGGRRYKGKLVNVIYVKARSADTVDQTIAEIQTIIRERHKIRPGKNDDFFIRNLSQILEARADSSRVMTLLLAAVASVSLLVGGIGIMNIMMVSVTERTREIGLRIALGATRQDILLQFLIEAVTLSLIGGLIGIGIGVGGAVTIANLGKWPTLIEPQAIILAFGFAAAVGVFFGFYPANMASKLNPIDALRYE